MKNPFSSEDEKIEPPKEIFMEERTFNNQSTSCYGYVDREALCGARMGDRWLAREDRDKQLVFVYKLSHVEIIKKKVEIIIERPKFS